MRAFRAEDLRSFTQALFTKDSFDDFLLREAEFRTFCVFSVNGRSERDWYTEEELEEERIEEYTAWRKLRPLCFQLIRGKKIPGAFHITFRLSPAGAEGFLRELRQGEDRAAVLARVPRGARCGQCHLLLARGRRFVLRRGARAGRRRAFHPRRP